jgi:hypothetical protein
MKLSLPAEIMPGSDALRAAGLKPAELPPCTAPVLGHSWKPGVVPGTLTHTYLIEASIPDGRIRARIPAHHLEAFRSIRVEVVSPVCIVITGFPGNKRLTFRPRRRKQYAVEIRHAEGEPPHFITGPGI